MAQEESAARKGRESSRSADRGIEPARVQELIHSYHAEIHTHSRGGEEIRISCRCAIGRDHSYGEWVELVGGDRYKAGSAAARG